MTPATQATAMTPPRSTPVDPSRPPSFLSAALRVFDLSLGQMLWSRRTIFMALVVAGPVVIAIFLRFLATVTTGTMRINNVPVDAVNIFGLMIWFFYLRFTVPVLALFYGTALMADEVEDKTITYLFTRPIPRGAVMMGKYLAYLACTVMVVLPSVVVVFFLTVPTGTGIAEGFPLLVKDLLLLGLGLVVYGALFAYVGARIKRPLLFGLLFLFGWEQAVLAFPGYLKRFTIAYYLQPLAPHAMPQDSAMALLQAVFRDTPSVPVSLAVLAGVTAVSLWLATRVVERREYVLEQ
jgi:ABC-2 type transport system permease protein